ncbi:putative bifunctional diguanylate cyclase/phosphodiesterase [Chelativorans salis]|uniref:EAL domain-containing protein n=1 Tax=Chelativorans salis TaxID=2978478 RepID=A0ABT2LJ94_9HYPH|nr:EAL domain-containing protein [Chelativorans sp. EGI FJ00035]MCT7374661.1 EAL domain-containing protein [Chelativorans sp. EGI FJ00035]
MLEAILIATIIIFALAAGYMSFLIFERQESLSKASRYDVSWSASQGVNEFVRLLQRVTALAEEPTTPRQEEVQLRFDILKGRLNLFRSGDFERFVNQTEERQAIVGRLNDLVEQLDEMIGRVDDPETAQRILRLMAPLEADLVGLASEAAYFSSVEITQFENELLQLHRNFSLVALGFFLCGLAFIALLGWHNRLLTRTHLRLRAANRDLRRASDDLTRMAHYDLLTGLPNRLLLRKHLEEMYTSAGGRIARGSRALMCLDLDNFKNVNDTLGHPAGDALLREVATRITNLVSQNGMVARLGGDEFVIILSNIGVEDAAALAGSLVEAIGKPYELEDHQVVVGTSIGIAFAPDAAGDPDSLLKDADLALYRAKDDGRGTYRFFEPEMDAQLQRRRMLELQLRSANFDTDFELLFQPLVDLQTKKVTTIEALLRWTSTFHGTVAPDEFIPIAEDSGLIVPLGAWVLEKACTLASDLPPYINVAVNLSATQIRRSNVVDTISTILSETGLSPDRLEVEITETLLLDDNREVNSALRQLRALGVRISLDDFGTGYSSLAYLRRFTVDKVKIDRSFVADIVGDPDHLAIVQAIVGLTHALGMTSVAEGLETEEQLLLIRASGCDEAQGYLFSPPVPEDEIKEFLARRGWKLRVA